MKRINASIPRWYENELRWRYPVTINRVRKIFVSSKPGKAGYNECKRKETLFRADQIDTAYTLFSDAWKDYLEDLSLRKGIDSNAYRSAEQTGRTNILPKMKNRILSEITDQDWQDLINKLKPIQKHKTELSRKTIMNIRGEIMLFCKYARKARLINHKPEDLEIPMTAKYVGKKILQISQLIEFLSDHDLNDKQLYIHAWQLMVVSGMRPGECYGLKESDISDGLINIKRSINVKNIITDGKNKNAIRTMYQTDIAKNIIERQKNKKKRLGIISPWLFPKLNGNIPNTGSAYNEWSDYRNCHNMAGIAVYSMRHTFSSYVDSKVGRKKLKCILGHSESMNTDSYIHELDGDQMAAKEAIDEAFGPILQIISK